MKRLSLTAWPADFRLVEVPLPFLSEGKAKEIYEKWNS